MRVIVCGSRTYTAGWDLGQKLDGLAAWCAWRGDDELTVLEGGAGGADRFAALWAQRAPVRSTVAGTVRVVWQRFDVEWERCGPGCHPRHRRRGRHGPYCPTAGLRRNERMLSEGRPDRVLAFVDKPLTRSRGTLDMTWRAFRAGIPVDVVTQPGTPT